MEKPPIQFKSHEKPDEQFEADIKKTIEELSNLKEGGCLFRGQPLVYQLYSGAEGDEINEENPAEGTMHPIFDPMARYEGIYEAYFVGVWRGIPEKYKPILVAHELKEHDSGSHEEAVEYEMEIARRVLNEQELEEYKKWRERYNKKI